jgi:hypothetical protein
VVISLRYVIVSLYHYTATPWMTGCYADAAVLDDVDLESGFRSSRESKIMYSIRQLAHADLKLAHNR